MYFFDQNSPNSIEFIVSSEETGYRHLYYVLASFNPQIAASEEEAFRRVQLQPQILKKVPITSGEWSVAFQQVTVDPDARLVFFHGYKGKYNLQVQLYIGYLVQYYSVVLL